MVKGLNTPRLLIIEDNPKDFLVIENYLRKEIEDPKLTYTNTSLLEKTLPDKKDQYNAVLLSLSFAECRNEQIVKTVVETFEPVPVIILAKNADNSTSLRMLALGVADFLIKEKLSSLELCKSISYCIERNSINQKLLASEEKYKNIFNHNPLPMWIVDKVDGSFLQVNEAAIMNYGYTREEFLNMNIQDLRPKEEIGKLESVLNDDTIRDKPFKGVSKHCTKNGKIIYVEVQSNIINFDDREVRMVLGANITEKVEAEKALRFSERRFKALVQEGSDLIAIVDLKGIYKYVSPTSLTILGVPPEKYIGKQVLDFIHEDDKERISKFPSIIRIHKRYYFAPYRFKDGNNQWRWVETMITNMVDDPAVGGIVANSRDVTQTIEKEAMLKESIERYDIVGKAAYNTIWDFNFKTGQIMWSRGIKDIFGYEDFKSANEDWWYSRIHPEDLKRVKEKFQYHFNNRIDKWEDEYRFRCADGSFKYVLDRGYLMLDEQGNQMRMIGSIQDITSKKVEEHRLMLMESVITHSTDAVIITKADKLNEPGPEILYVNEAFVKMTGYTKEEVIGKSPRFLQGPKTDRTVLRQLKESLKGGLPCEIEVVNYDKFGQEYWVWMDISPVTDSDGIITHFIAIGKDVTDRKKYIQAIEDQNQKFREIAWMQSHLVRAPLARIMGLLNFFSSLTLEKKETGNVVDLINASAKELDEIIREIVRKTEQV